MPYRLEGSFCAGVFKGMKCIFCRFGIEDRDLRSFIFLLWVSGRIWKNVMETYVVLNPPTCWHDVVSLGLNEWRGKTMKAYIGSLVLGSSIYNIWRTGNALRHGNNPLAEEKIKW